MLAASIEPVDYDTQRQTSTNPGPPGLYRRCWADRKYWATPLGQLRQSDRHAADATGE